MSIALTSNADKLVAFVTRRDLHGVITLGRLPVLGFSKDLGDRARGLVVNPDSNNGLLWSAIDVPGFLGLGFSETDMQTKAQEYWDKVDRLADEAAGKKK